MSAERDLAIARAVAWEARYGPKTNASGELYDYTDAELRAIIAAVDASLGGKAGDSHAPAPVLDRAAEEGAGGAPTANPALHPESRSAQAAEPPSDPGRHSDIVELCLRIDAFVNAAGDQVKHWTKGFDEGYAKAKRAEQQRAVGIMRALLDTDYLPEEIDAAVEAANDYIAEAEAAQKGEGC